MPDKEKKSSEEKLNEAIVYPVSDPADYLDGPPPLYEDEVDENDEPIPRPRTRADLFFESRARREREEKERGEG